MELRIYDSSLHLLGVVDEANSLIWSGTYWQQGDFGDMKMIAPVTENNNAMLVKGNIAVKHGDGPEFTDASGGIWRRAVQITYRHITKDEEDIEQIEVQGCLLKKWLSKRIIEKQVLVTARDQEIINKIVRENMGESASENRQFPQFTMLEQPDMGGDAVEFSNEAYENCAVEIFNRAIVSKLGYDILVNERSRQYGFYLWKGRDLTAANTDGNTPCVFSRTFDNVNELEYEESIENMKSTVYVTGAADENNIKSTIEVSDGAEGFDRDEVYLEASDIGRTAIQPDGTEISIDDETYLRLLADRGNVELSEYGMTVNFEAVVNVKSNLEYKRDFDIGDIITCTEPQWGIKIDARITKINNIYQKGKETIEATFGESMPTLIEKIKKVRQ